MLEQYGLKFSPPENFAPVEFMVTLSAPPVDALKDPRMMQKQFPVRPNLIVHRRLTGETATVELLSSEVCAELIASIPAMKNLETASFAFDDGANGILVTFDFPAGRATVRQFQAMRLDDGAFTTMTLTVDSTTLSDSVRDTYFKALATMGAPAKSEKPGTLAV